MEMNSEFEEVNDDLSSLEIQAASEEGENEEKKKQVAQNMHHNINQVPLLKLPREVLLYILKWVVSNNLDIVSLGNWSLTCRDFYLLAQDSSFWHTVCKMIWGKNVSLRPYSSWSSLYLNTPHLYNHGVYISRTSYLRSGDNSLSQYHRPYYVVEYFRILRFLPNAEVMMLTTPQDPREAVSKLQTKSRKHQGLLVGRYWVQEEKEGKNPGRTLVTAVLESYHIPKDSTNHNARNQMQPPNPPKAKDEYHLELELSSTSSKRKFNKLSWVHHSCCTKYVSLGRESTCVFDVKRQYPALYFNSIKAFTMEADNPL